jgi:hypothetical protein
MDKEGDEGHGDGGCDGEEGDGDIRSGGEPWRCSFLFSSPAVLLGMRLAAVRLRTPEHSV